MFHLYAYEPLTLDGLIERLTAEGRVYRLPVMPFAKGSVHNILRDRAYLGEIEFRGNWYLGKHEPLVDRGTWDRVQAIVRGCVYHSHEMTYAGEFMTCGHCGHPITGERKTRSTKSGEKEYIYYRCSRYTAEGHPRIRVPEADLDRQMLDLFGRMKVQDPDVAEWFRTVLRSQSSDAQQETLAQNAELQRQRSLLMTQQSRLVDLRLAEDIDQETFARKQTELRDRLASITLQLEVVGRSQAELIELAMKVFELSQTLSEKWLAADYATKRRILEIVCLNCRLVDGSLSPTMRKPFDVLAEGLLVPSSRGDPRWAFRNELSSTKLLHFAIAESRSFTADEFWRFAES